jgi:hypothetical protein
VTSTLLAISWAVDGVRGRLNVLSYCKSPRNRILCVLYWYAPCLSAMVGISTHLVISVCTWCVSVRILSWCVILHIMYSKTVQPQSHQKTCALFLLFTTIGVLLQYNTLCVLYWYTPCLSVMVRISTYLVISVRTWCVSVRISSWCVILHIMYSKTVQPQSHQKTRTLFLLFTTIGVVLQYNTAPSNYAYCTDTHHVFQSWCVSVRISSYQYAHGAYQYASHPDV